MTRIGFIGAGGIAERHLHVLAAMADVEVAAFADPVMALVRQQVRSALAIVEAVEQMNSTRTGGGDADPDFGRELDCGGGHLPGHLFMPDLNEADVPLAPGARGNQPADAVAGVAEHAPHPQSRRRCRMKSATVSSAMRKLLTNRRISPVNPQNSG